MIKIADNKLIIELETPYPCELLYELQTSLIAVLRLRDESQETDRFESHCVLKLLNDLLPPAKCMNSYYR